MEQDVLLEKYLNGSLTPEEKHAFEARPDYGFTKMLLEDATAFKASHFSQAADYAFLEQKLPSPQATKTFIFKPLLRYAAVIAVAIATYFVVFNDWSTKVKTSLAQQTTIELPDASSVTLNALSSLKYNKGTWDDKRVVSLQGEAYFVVAKGATFDVQTTAGIVRVLGTQFSVKQRDTYFEVQCYEGKVAVIQAGKTVELLPGDAFRILNGKTQDFSFNRERPSWLNNRSSFINIPLAEVLAELERQYDIKIISKQIDTGLLFHGVFVNDNLENALKQITLPLSLTYVINQDRTVILKNLEAN